MLENEQITLDRIILMLLQRIHNISNCNMLGINDRLRTVPFAFDIGWGEGSENRQMGVGGVGPLTI